jgi:hypothetical protein
MSSFLKPMRRKAAFSVFSDIQRETDRTDGNRNLPSSVNFRSFLRTATARGASGTRCGSRIFIRPAGISHPAASRSNSTHSAARNSAWANESQGEQFEGGPCFEGPLIVFDSAQQAAESLWRDDGRSRRHGWRYQRPA